MSSFALDLIFVVAELGGSIVAIVGILTAIGWGLERYDEANGRDSSARYPRRPSPRPASRIGSAG